MHVVKVAKEEGKEDRGKGSALFFEGRRRSFGVDIKLPGIEKWSYMANDNRLSGKYQKYEWKIVLKSNFIGLNDTVIRIMLKKIDEKSN